MDHFLHPTPSYISLSDKSAQADSIDFYHPPPYSSVPLPPMDTSYIDSRIATIAAHAE